MRAIWIAAAIALATMAGAMAANGRGFGDAYDWHNLEDGLRLAREQQKPAMIVIHKVRTLRYDGLHACARVLAHSVTQCRNCE